MFLNLAVLKSPVNTVLYRRLFFSASDRFLDGSLPLSSDINYFIQVPENVENALQEFYTLLADLREPEETLWQNLYHRTRTEIRSFLNNQRFEHHLELNLPDKELKRFIELFNRFAKHKGIRPAEQERLKAYNKAGILAVSYLMQNNEALCINFYRVTPERAANLYSFHRLHELGSMFNSTHTGRAHRALHWLDMLAFKKRAVHYYDFCGWYAGQTDRHLLNINAFKEQFTRHKIKEYSGVIYKNKLLMLLLKFTR